MKGTLDSGGSGSQSDREIVPATPTDVSHHLGIPSPDNDLGTAAADAQDGPEGIPPKGEAAVRAHAGPDSDLSATKTYRPVPESESSAFDAEQEKTIISQRPVAAPEEFYRSMPLAELATLLEGKQLDHFFVEQMIGGGGMGAVFRGRDERLDRTVAIKVIPAAKRDPDTLRRFRLEAQAAARLDHPNIARVYYVGEAEQWNYIVFEFIDGVNIRDLVDMQGPLSVDDAVYYTRQVAEALQHAHQREVVHRDIKPSNILVTAAGIAKVVDMGLARNTGLDQSTADATASGVTLGTFDYISPEQARNPRDADVRSDLYSLGCSLFFMLTGKPPFPEGTVLQKLLKHGSVPPPDPRAWREDLSDQIYAILMKLMAKQPSERYQNPLELVNDLMLLAEIEELPRSLSPGTMIFTPTVAQRSLLETNLPWLVAFAFLLGSTLWLQSVQAISQGFVLPPLRFSSNAAIVEPRTEPEPTLDSENGATLVPSLPQRDGEEVLELPVDRTSKDYLGGKLFPKNVVVSQFRPADVPEDRWFRSLAQALQAMDPGGSLEIEIRGSVELEQPIVHRRRSLHIRGFPGAQSRVEIHSRLTRDLPDWAAAFQIEDGQVLVEGVEFRMENTSTEDNRAVGLFELIGSSELNLKQVQVTITGPGNPLNSFAVLVDESKQTLGSKSLGAFVADSGSQDFHDTSIHFENSLVRGSGSGVRLRASSARMNRFSMSISNRSLLALGGVALDVRQVPSNLSMPMERNVRIYCDQSICYSAQGFARVSFAELNDSMLSLNRTSERCVYESNSGYPHISLVGLDPENATADLNRFLFKGSDNAYDEKVQVLCKCYNRENIEISSIAFSEAAKEGWFEERGNDRQVRWSQPRAASLELSDLTRAEFGVVEDRFSPSF